MMQSRNQDHRIMKFTGADNSSVHASCLVSLSIEPLSLQFRDTKKDKEDAFLGILRLQIKITSANVIKRFYFKYLLQKPYKNSNHNLDSSQQENDSIAHAQKSTDSDMGERRSSGGGTMSSIFSYLTKGRNR